MNYSDSFIETIVFGFIGSILFFFVHSLVLRISWFYSNLIKLPDLLTDLNDQLSCRLRWCISCIILFFSCPSSCLSWYSWINRANIVYSLPGFIKVPSSLSLSQYSQWSFFLWFPTYYVTNSISLDNTWFTLTSLFPDVADNENGFLFPSQL